MEEASEGKGRRKGEGEGRRKEVERIREEEREEDYGESSNPKLLPIQ